MPACLRVGYPRASPSRNVDMVPIEAIRDRVDVLVERCYAGLGPDLFPREMLHRLRRIIPVDAAFFATIDPVTMLFTSAVSEEPLVQAAPEFLENEIGGADVNRFTDLAVAADPVSSLDVATGGDRWASARYRDVMAPLRLGDELRAALVSGGRCWAVLCLHRESSPTGFSPRELALLRRLVPHLAEGVRRSAFAVTDRGEPSKVGTGRAARSPGESVPGPGVLTLDAVGDVISISPEAEYWLDQLPGGDLAHRLPLPVGIHTAVAQSALARGSSAPAPTVRLRTLGGQWLSVHVTTLPSPAGTTTAVVLAPTSPEQLASLLLDAHGLTPAQQRVAALVLRGFSTREIVRELHISAYTVQEHLRAVFDKLGVGSRRELIVTLLSSG